MVLFAKLTQFCLSMVLFSCSLSFRPSVSRIGDLQGSSCKQVGLQGFFVKLRFKYTRNNPEVRLREFFWCYRLANTGNCNDVPDKFSLSFDTWHFVEGGGRLFKLCSNEFAARSHLDWVQLLQFSSVCRAPVCVDVLKRCLCFFLSLFCFSSVSSLRYGLGRLCWYTVLAGYMEFSCSASVLFVGQ